MLYVYALLGSDPRGSAGTGIQGEPLRILPCGDLFAAVSEMDEAPPLEEPSLRGHERTVRELAGRVEAILPARFGSVTPDEATLARLLKGRETGLREALALVRGREQMTLRVFGESAPRPQTVSGEDPALGPGARYLAGKMREHEAEHWVAGLEALRPKLARFVRAEHIERHNTPPLVASVYHLIERGESNGYLAALNEVASSDPPLRFTASGPWPPYAFGRWE